MTNLEIVLLECPKEKCFHWICPGGAADMSGQVYKDLQESFQKGKWVKFPDGGCSCSEKCVRLHPDSSEDWYEPC
jgi:hypothetical protein